MVDERRTDTSGSGEDRSWHATDIDSVMATLETSPSGLHVDEVARRLASHGRNELPSTPAAGSSRRLPTAA